MDCSLPGCSIHGIFQAKVRKAKLTSAESIYPFVFLTGPHLSIPDDCLSFLSALSSVQWFSCVRLFATPWTAACQASLSITSPRSLLKLMSVESMMPSNHLILCCPLLFLPSIFSSIRVFSNESVLHIRWPKSWPKYFGFNISLSNENSGLIFFRMDWLDLLAV